MRRPRRRFDASPVDRELRIAGRTLRAYGRAERLDEPFDSQAVTGSPPIVWVARLRAPICCRGIRARCRWRSGRGPRWRPDRRCAQPARTSSAGIVVASMDAPCAPPFSRAVQPPLVAGASML